jgi:hypothetical protein
MGCLLKKMMTERLAVVSSLGKHEREGKYLMVMRMYVIA